MNSRKEKTEEDSTKKGSTENEKEQEVRYAVGRAPGYAGQSSETEYVVDWHACTTGEDASKPRVAIPTHIRHHIEKKSNANEKKSKKISDKYDLIKTKIVKVKKIDVKDLGSAEGVERLLERPKCASPQREMKRNEDIEQTVSMNYYSI